MLLKLILNLICRDYNYESKPEVQNVPLAMCNCKIADVMRRPSQRQRYYVMSVLNLKKAKGTVLILDFNYV